MILFAVHISGLAVVFVEDTETVSHSSPPGEPVDLGFPDIQHLNRLPFI